MPNIDDEADDVLDRLAENHFRHWRPELDGEDAVNAPHAAQDLEFYLAQITPEAVRDDFQDRTGRIYRGHAGRLCSALKAKVRDLLDDAT